MLSRLPVLSFLALSFLFSNVLSAAVDQQALNVNPIRVATSWDWSNCGDPEDAIQIESIEVSPDPPEAGKEMTVTVKGSAEKVIEDGAYADVTVKVGVIKIIDRRFDVCEEALNANATVQCPVDKGHYTVEQTVKLPKEIPPAKLNVGVRGFTVDEEDMLCLNIMVDFRKFPRFW